MDGQTVLVTGAGRGIGRACAELAAKEGAKVLVNDLGGGLSGGDEGGLAPAVETAKAIRDAGGNAAANTDDISSFAGAKAMVEQARDELGGLHAVISPAGILRDKMFHKMSEQDWDAVINVHLKGAFNVARAAIEGFREQEGGGSFVFFTSTSGIIGNIGQANYAAAKMGVVGLSRIIAMEGERRKVRANVIAPFAWTRMIASIPITDEASRQRVERMRTHMRADQVAPLAVALAAPACPDSGEVFVVRGAEVVLMSQARPLRSLARVEGWDVNGVLNHALPALRPAKHGLGATGSVFSWDPI